MLSEKKIRKINEHIDAFLAKNQTVRTAHLVQNDEPFSRRVSPYLELMQDVEDFVNQNLVSLGNFLRRFPGKAQGYYDKCEGFLQEIAGKQYEMKRDFGLKVDIVIGRLKSLRKWLVQKI